MPEDGIRHEVLLTRGAEQDLEAIYEYISKFDCVTNANYVLDQLVEVAHGLSTYPERGSIPRELDALGIREYRQTFFKPYRLIYRVIETRVLVYVIADGRRDMQTLLMRRILGT